MDKVKYPKGFCVVSFHERGSIFLARGGLAPSHQPDFVSPVAFGKCDGNFCYYVAVRNIKLKPATSKIFSHKVYL